MQERCAYNVEGNQSRYEHSRKEANCKIQMRICSGSTKTATRRWFTVRSPERIFNCNFRKTGDNFDRFSKRKDIFVSFPSDAKTRDDFDQFSKRKEIFVSLPSELNTRLEQRSQWYLLVVEISTGTMTTLSLKG